MQNNNIMDECTKLLYGKNIYITKLTQFLFLVYNSSMVNPVERE